MEIFVRKITLKIYGKIGLKVTTTETEEFILKLFVLLLEYERKRLIRRTKAGQETARARGRMGGRLKEILPCYQEIASMMISAYKEQRSIRDIIKAFPIPSTTMVYKILKDDNVPFQVHKKLNDDQIN